MEHDLITATAGLFQEGDMRSLEVQLPDHPPVQHSRREPGHGLYHICASSGRKYRPGRFLSRGRLSKEETRNYIVDGSYVRRICDNPGEFTFREALQAVAAKRGTVPQPQEAGNSLLDLANAIKVLNPDPTKLLTIERLTQSRRKKRNEPVPG